MTDGCKVAIDAISGITQYALGRTDGGSRVAQWKRAGPITQRSVDRNHALLVHPPLRPLHRRWLVVCAPGRDRLWLLFTTNFFCSINRLVHRIPHSAFRFPHPMHAHHTMRTELHSFPQSLMHSLIHPPSTCPRGGNPCGRLPARPAPPPPPPASLYRVATRIHILPLCARVCMRILKG